MRVLFLDHEQYGHYLTEAGHFEVRLPILACGCVSEHRDYVYQRVIREAGMDAAIAGAIEAAAQFSPDVIIFIATWPHECLPPEVLEFWESAGIPTISVLWDTSLRGEVNSKFCSRYFHASRYVCDAGSFFGYARYRLWSDFMNLGKTSIFLSGYNVIPERFSAPEQKKDIDVALIGSVHKYRAELLQKLNSQLADKTIFVRQIGGMVDETVAHPYTGGSGRRVSDRDYIDYIHRTKILLCPSGQADQWGVRGKIFEFLAAGAFCLVEANPDVVFTIPKGVVANYTTVEECAENIEMYLADEPARRSLARRGRDWFYDTYDCKSYWRNILSGITGGAGEIWHSKFVEENYRIAHDRIAASLNGNTPTHEHFESLEFGF